MRATIELGRISGVRVGLHWSVLGIVVLLITILSVRLPNIAEGYPWGLYLLAAAVTAVLFVASLFAHEMAHAIMARRNGVDVDGITLWLLGGVARLRSEALTPGAELRISGIGPVTSLGVAAVFGAVAWLVDTAGLGQLSMSVFRYLAGINVLLAVFNVIPAAPLDGGRILRAVVWAWRGDRLTATVLAARAGRLFGFVLIGLGFIQAISGVGLGLWWILLGLFVVTMASAEEHQARISTALSGLRVRDVMTAHPETAQAERNVAEFLQDVALLRRHSAFPLLDASGRLQGLVTLNRIRSIPLERRPSTSLREAACPPGEIPLAEPDDPLPALLARLNGCSDGRALVFTHGKLVGIVSPSDVARAAALHGVGVPPGGGADITDWRHLR